MWKGQTENLCIVCFFNHKELLCYKKGLVWSIIQPPNPHKQSYLCYIDIFLISWTDSTLHRSIYVTQQLEFRKRAHYLKVHLLCIALGHFLILSILFSLEKLNHTWFFYSNFYDSDVSCLDSIIVDFVLILQVDTF